MVELLLSTPALEEYALVDITYNEKPVDRVVTNGDKRCLFFRFAPPSIREMLAPSRFIVVVDPEKCLGCKTCVELCLFEAAQTKYYPEF